MNFIVSIWNKIPVIIRAIINGLAVQVVGFVLLLTILPLNEKYMPNVPWVLAPLAIALWLYWSYFGGRWAPRGSSDLRRNYRRAHRIKSGLIRPVIFTGIIYAATIICISILQYSMHELPVEALGMIPMLAGFPILTSVPIALLAAVFVGMGEEMSFRGYMQVPLERKYGPWIFLTIPALIFAFAHGLDPERLPVFFLVSLGWGVMAWTTGSIWPGILLHVFIDATGFLWGILALEDLELLMRMDLSENGWTSEFQVLAIITGILICLSMFGFVNLVKKSRALS